VSRKLIVNDGKRQRELLLVGTMVVGRDPSCDISEADPLLSRRHVEFVAGASDVVVRDLGSRNGILINGVKTTQAILRPGDMVQVGHLQVTFVEDAAPISASVSPVDDDATALMAPPRMPTAAASPPPPPPQVPPPDLPTLAVPPPRATVLSAAESPKAAPPAEAPAPSVKEPVDDPEKTRFFPPPSAAPAPIAAGPATPPPPQPIAPAAASTGVHEDPDATRFVPPPPPPPAGWPVSSAPVHTPAADDDKTRVVSPPAAASASPPPRPRPVQIEQPPARPQGRTTTAPNERAKTRVAQGSWTFFVLMQVAALAAIVFLVAAIPLILWRPENAGSVAAVLALPVVIALIAAWVSSQLITRKAIGALTALHEDFELALGGKLDHIGDPLGVKPVSDLAHALNSQLVKLRSGASLDPVRSADAPKPSPVVSVFPARPVEPQPAAKHLGRLDARIVTNAQFRVTEASRDCADLIGIQPDALVGQHLIDAIPDSAIGDAVLQSLSALGASGEHRTIVPMGPDRGDVSIVVSRDGRDKPLTIVITRASEVAV
jgi:pSer/pThr/pTyr-binding forkhead associated (FHA) protein